MKTIELINIEMQILTAIDTIDKLKVSIKEKDWYDEQNKEDALTSIESAVIDLDEIEDIVDRDIAVKDAIE